jgi:hypothetical protein
MYPAAIATENRRGLLDLVDELWSATVATELVARPRCADDFLDLYGATDEPAVHEEIAAFLTRTTGRTMLEGTEVLDALGRVAAAAAVESAFSPLVLPAS